MRKVSLEIEATVLLPVKVLLDVEVRADEGANMEQAVRRYCRGQSYSKADVEDVQVSLVTKIGTVFVNKDMNECVMEAVQDQVDNLGYTLSTVSTWNVVDSR